MKIAHALVMWLIVLAIWNFIIANLVLTKKQYTLILGLTLVISILYFLPCLYIAKITFRQQENSGQIFLDWCSLLFSASELNWYGLLLAVFIHA